MCALKDVCSFMCKLIWGYLCKCGSLPGLRYLSVKVMPSVSSVDSYSKHVTAVYSAEFTATFAITELTNVPEIPFG